MKSLVKRPELHYAHISVEANSPEEALELVKNNEENEILYLEFVEILDQK